MFKILFEIVDKFLICHIQIHHVDITSCYQGENALIRATSGLWQLSQLHIRPVMKKMENHISHYNLSNINNSRNNKKNKISHNSHTLKSNKWIMKPSLLGAYSTLLVTLNSILGIRLMLIFWSNASISLDLPKLPKISCKSSHISQGSSRHFSKIVKASLSPPHY